MLQRGLSETKSYSLLAYAFIALLALVLRGGRLWMVFPQHGWQDLGYGWELGRVAANIAAGNGMSSPFKVGDVPTAWFMPATPLFWGAIFTIFGTFSKGSLIALYVIECLLRAVAGCVYLTLLGALLPKGSSKKAPIFITTAVLIAPDHLVSLTRPWYWGLQEVGIALMLLYTLKWHRTNTLRDAVKLGIVSGATLLVNSVPALLLGGLLVQAIVRADNRKHSVRGALLVVLMCGACLTPWIARNYAVFGTFIPFRQNTWIEIRQGNNPNGAIVQGLQSLHPNVLPIEGIKYDEQGERDYEDNARRETVTYVADHVGITLKRFVTRAGFFWFSDLFHEGVYGDRRWEQKTLYEKGRDLGIFLWAVVPVGIVAMQLCTVFGRHITMHWLLVTPVVVLPIPYYLSHIHPVYFGSVKPLLILLAGMVVSEVVQGTTLACKHTTTTNGTKGKRSGDRERAPQDYKIKISFSPMG